MKDKEITIPADVDSVSLRIEREPRSVKTPTLRELLMATKCCVNVRILIRESVRPEGESKQETEFYWSVDLPAVVDSMYNREMRIKTLACATLCDAGVLLDEREVTVGHDDSRVLFTLEANPGESHG